MIDSKDIRPSKEKDRPILTELLECHKKIKELESNLLRRELEIEDLKREMHNLKTTDFNSKEVKELKNKVKELESNLEIKQMILNKYEKELYG